jgi:hypothetical protein
MLPLAKPLNTVAYTAGFLAHEVAAMAEFTPDQGAARA